MEVVQTVSSQDHIYVYQVAMVQTARAQFERYTPPPLTYPNSVIVVMWPIRNLR